LLSGKLGFSPVLEVPEAVRAENAIKEAALEAARIYTRSLDVPPERMSDVVRDHVYEGWPVFDRERLTGRKLREYAVLGFFDGTAWQNDSIPLPSCSSSLTGERILGSLDCHASLLLFLPASS